MDADWMTMTLQDALSALADVVGEIEAEPEAAEELMEELMPAVFAKLNYAWNTRKVGPSAIDTMDHDDLIAWPKDMKL